MIAWRVTLLVRVVDGILGTHKFTCIVRPRVATIRRVSRSAVTAGSRARAYAETPALDSLRLSVTGPGRESAISPDDRSNDLGDGPGEGGWSRSAGGVGSGDGDTGGA